MDIVRSTNVNSGAPLRHLIISNSGTGPMPGPRRRAGPDHAWQDRGHRPTCCPSRSIAPSCAGRLSRRGRHHRPVPRAVRRVSDAHDLRARLAVTPESCATRRRGRDRTEKANLHITNSARVGPVDGDEEPALVTLSKSRRAPDDVARDAEFPRGCRREVPDTIVFTYLRRRTTRSTSR